MQRMAVEPGTLIQAVLDGNHLAAGDYEIPSERYS